MNGDNSVLVQERPERVLTATDIRAQVNLIQEVMKAVMQNGQHYGVVPGCGNKPTLLKPGAEKLLSTFRIAVDPIVEDLSTPDEARYRIIAKGISQNTGVFLGGGVGEASSNEEKYKWKKASCKEEFEATPEDRRRIKWFAPYGKQPFSVEQVRTNPADVANTILKMAKKRAQIDMTLTVTAASDIFTQDIEDMADIATVEPVPHKTDNQSPEQQPDTQPTLRQGKTITKPQRKRMFAKMKAGGKTPEQLKEYMKTIHGIEHTEDITMGDVYDDICGWLDQPLEI